MKNRFLWATVFFSFGTVVLSCQSDATTEEETDSSSDSWSESGMDSGTGSETQETESETPSTSDTESDTASNSATITDFETVSDTVSSTNSDMGSDSTTETQTGCEYECPDNAQLGCVGAIVLCLDGDDEPVETVAECEDGELCIEGDDSCVACECLKDFETHCDAEGDVRYFDSCGKPGALERECEVCEACEENSPTQASCVPNNVQFVLGCAADGNVRWYDSCGGLGAVFEVCDVLPWCADGHCVECLEDAHCDDSEFCTGAETCAAGVCQEATASCLELCDEDQDLCVECLDDTDCDDGIFCNGLESCAVGACQEATAPCPELCDEDQDLCVECLGDTDCDDGIFCNGLESCAVGACQEATAPCSELCDEDQDLCVECFGDFECEAASFCDQQGLCQPCTEDAHCGSACDDCGAGGLVCTSQGSNCTTDCQGQPDFTPCQLEVEPNFSYDICVAGECVSPGCGDASCNVPGPHFPLPDTNQRQCYDATDLISCPAAGESFFGQDAQYGRNVTHPTEVRYARTIVGALNQSLVSDNITGLMWQGCPLGLSGEACSEGSARVLTWSVALEECDTSAWGGLTDWRLPDPYELASLVDAGQSALSIDTDAFPGTPAARFWTSSTYAASTNVSAKRIDFSGGILNDDLKIRELYVRCVRGAGAVSLPRFVRDMTTAEQPIVQDNATGLEWQGCVYGRSGPDCAAGSPYSKTWQGALDYCETLTWAGLTDWRLPNPQEILSILDHRRNSPAVDPDFFPATPTSWLWLSSTLASDATKGWYAYLNPGIIGQYGKNISSNVRCVRGTSAELPPSTDPSTDTDANAGCSSDEECDDGDFCNGLERCTAENSCELGASPCPLACDENMDACVQCLDNFDCDAGAYCAADGNCAVCDVDEHCGPGCDNCAENELICVGATPACAFDCTGKADFTPCTVVTVPDRADDICVHEICVSPGCGDFSCNMPGPSFPLPDTNQRVCYGANALMECPAANEVYYGQDAQFGWDTQHSASERYSRDTSTVPNEPVVTDLVTGLVWQGCMSSRQGPTCWDGDLDAMNWNEAVAYCDALNWGGFADWRLPDAFELRSIVDSDRTDPTLDIAAFPNSSSNFYWTNVTLPTAPGTAISIYFNTGYQNRESKSEVDFHYARCVRGGRSLSRSLSPAQIDGERVVRDPALGLMWQGCAEGLSRSDCAGTAVEVSWAEAMQRCKGLELAGYTDWRLPNVQELSSLIDPWHILPSIDQVLFPNPPTRPVWTSTTWKKPDPILPYKAWEISFQLMSVNGVDKTAFENVLCVRDAT